MIGKDVEPIIRKGSLSQSTALPSVTLTREWLSVAVATLWATIFFAFSIVHISSIFSRLKLAVTRTGSMCALLATAEPSLSLYKGAACTDRGNAE